MHYFAIDTHQKSLLEKHASNAALKEGVQGVGWGDFGDSLHKVRVPSQ